MPKVTLVSNNTFSGILFLNYLVWHDITIEKIYVISSLRGRFLPKLKKGVALLKAKSKCFLLYKYFIEKIFFRLLCIDGMYLLSEHDISKKYNIPIEFVGDVNAPHFISQITKSKNNEDLVLSAYGSQIFCADLVNAVNNFWNIHGSYLPFFRGAAPYFWMLFKNDYPRGVTLHHVIPQLDAGENICQKIVEPDKEDSMFIYHARCVIAAAKMFIEIFSNHYFQILKGEINEMKKSSGSMDMINVEITEGALVQDRNYGLPLPSDMKAFWQTGSKLFYFEDKNRLKELLKG